MMSRYEELRSEFLENHKYADELVMSNNGMSQPIQAIYYAPDPLADYESVDKLIEMINSQEEDDE